MKELSSRVGGLELEGDRGLPSAAPFVHSERGPNVDEGALGGSLVTCLAEAGAVGMARYV